MSQQASSGEFIAWFETLAKGDVGRVGGKNASLGEMVQRFVAAARPVAQTETRRGAKAGRASVP